MINSSKTILLVEDDELLVSILSEILHYHGFKTKSFIDPVEALAYLFNSEQTEKTLPDVIITDINMPRMNGIELLREIVKLNHCKLIPKLCLTAVDKDETRQSALSLGVDKYLVKPVETKVLINTIEDILNARSKAQSDEKERGTIGYVG